MGQDRNDDDDKKDIEEGNDYRESEDEDFNPDGVNDDELSSDGDDDDDESKEERAQIKGYDKLQGSNLIKTRAQREQEANEEKRYKQVEKSTADIDALWASMKSSKSKSTSTNDGNSTTTTSTTNTKASSNTPPAETTEKVEHNDNEEYITIERTYKFAGEVTTEKKRVPKSSAEAKAYLAQQADPSSIKTDNKLEESTVEPAAAPVAKKRKGPPKKKRSALDAELGSNKKPQKMNTLEKSRLDWAGFVDKEGISDELTHHNKGGYLHKQDFLSKVEQRRDEEFKKYRSQQK